MMFLSALVLPLLLAADPDVKLERPLWPDKIPGTATIDPKTVPTLTYFPAKEPNGTAVVICPGGGYGAMAMDHEGREIAQWLNARGVAAFVLKYRVAGNPPAKSPEDPLKKNFPYCKAPLMDAPMLDLQRAIRTVRATAKEAEIDPKRIGVWGFSAGGHLASTGATHFDSGLKEGDAIDKVSCRPDFAILAYPVITMGKETHGGSKNNLIGAKPDEALLEKFSNEKQVTKETPPTFLFHTVEDKAVPIENSRKFKEACEKNGVAVELVEMEKGAHGIGLGGSRVKGLPAENWPEKLEAWLKKRGLLEK